MQKTPRPPLACSCCSHKHERGVIYVSLRLRVCSMQIPFMITQHVKNTKAPALITSTIHLLQLFLPTCVPEERKEGEGGGGGVHLLCILISATGYSFSVECATLPAARGKSQHHNVSLITICTLMNEVRRVPWSLIICMCASSNTLRFWPSVRSSCTITTLETYIQSKLITQ